MTIIMIILTVCIIIITIITVIIHIIITEDVLKVALIDEESPATQNGCVSLEEFNLLQEEVLSCCFISVESDEFEEIENFLGQRSHDLKFQSEEDIFIPGQTQE